MIIEKKLADLKEEKRIILEEVKGLFNSYLKSKLDLCCIEFLFKEKETYKKAREILERFSNGDLNITPPITPSQNNSGTFPQSTPYITSNAQSNKNANLVQRNIKNQMQQQQQHNGQFPNKTFTSPSNETINLNKTSMYGNPNDSSKFVQPQLPTPQLNQTSQTNPPPSSFALASSARTLLPRPILAPHRTFFDKILDFVIGEGPNNR